MKELILDATVDNLKPVFSFVTEELTAQGCEKRDIRQVKLCVEEVFINIVNYAYRPDVGPVRVTIDIPDITPDSIRVVISFFDSGHPFNPLTESPPDLSLDLTERPVGGLGIFLVREKMDDVMYEYRDGQNILTIQKAITRAAQSA